MMRTRIQYVEGVARTNRISTDKGPIVLEAIAFIVAVPFLLLILGLATIAFRGGEHAGHHETAAATAGGGGTIVIRRRTRISPVNQFLVWGLCLTLVAATIAMLIASFVWDSWVWH